jgi:hypothetical protein
MAAGEKGGKSAESKVAAAKGDKDLAKAASAEASQEAPPEEEPTPPMPEEPVPESEAVNSLSDLENMVDDIAAELGMGDKEEKE